MFKIIHTGILKHNQKVRISSPSKLVQGSTVKLFDEDLQSWIDVVPSSVWYYIADQDGERIKAPGSSEKISSASESLLNLVRQLVEKEQDPMIIRSFVASMLHDFYALGFEDGCTSAHRKMISLN